MIGPHLSSWQTPASRYPRRRVGCAKIRTCRYPAGVYHCYMQRGHEYYVADRRLSITTLTIDGETWMVDDPPHWWGMEAHAAVYRGHVLCAGLGLGLMVHALDANPAVTRITVVEREADVIELVQPLVPNDKLTVVHGDFFDIGPQDVAPIDGVLFDLFVGDGRDLFSLGIRVCAGVLMRWPDALVRVHGLPNPLVGDIAATTIEAQRPREAYEPTQAAS